MARVSRGDATAFPPVRRGEERTLLVPAKRRQRLRHKITFDNLYGRPRELIDGTSAPRTS
jgi:hypothetical protein